MVNGKRGYLLPVLLIGCVLVIFHLSFLWGATYMVTNTNDSGAGSLRQAILDANSNAGLDTIEFNIPGTGPFSIQPLSLLPDITDQINIDGYTQPGASSATDTSPATLLIELDGINIGYNGPGIRFINGSSGSIIKGLVVNNFLSSSGGIYLYQSNNNTIQGCYIGTNTAGTQAKQNGRGIYVSESSNNQIGGTLISQRNIISGNDTSNIILSNANENIIEGNLIGTDSTGKFGIDNHSTGFWISNSNNNIIGGTNPGSRNLISGNGVGISIHRAGTGSSGNNIIGNFIGTDIMGTEPLSNDQGIWFDADGNTVGGNTPGHRNIISGNIQFGVGIFGDSNIIKGNYIGTDVTGTINLGNGSYGIEIRSFSFSSSFNNIIGGTEPGEKNIIAYNNDDGIYLNGPQTLNNLISGNSIFSNGGLGIDLYPGGVTANDLNDGDTGSNNRQNYPVIDKVIRHAASIEIRGTLNSTADTSFVLEFFSNSSLDASGYGEGETYLGSINVTTDSSGNTPFTAIFSTVVPEDYYITATATDPNNNTSEFSAGQQAPTLALISSFRVYSDGGPVKVHWETASEIGTAGFYLLRKDDSNGQYHPVNETFLPGLLHSPQGGIYRFVDYTASYGETYTYKLVEVESQGGKRTHGPFTVTVGAYTHQPGMEDSGSILEPMQGIYSKQPHEVSSTRKARLQARQLSLDTARVLKKSRVGDEAKIIVKEMGLYYLDAAIIADVLGMSSGQIRQRIRNHHFLLFNQGQDVAYIPAKGNTGLYFYGEAIDSIYTDENIYWLGKGKGLNMGSVYGGLPSPAMGNETFSDTIHIEEDQYALTALFSDPESDYWLWDYITAGEGGKTFAFYAHGTAEGGTANLTVHLKGATEARVTPDHHAKVSLNGSLIGESEWNGTNDHTFTISFSQSLLIDGENTIEVTGVLNNGVPYSIFYVDSFDLSYHRHYRAVNNRLLCRGDQNPKITIEGFTDPNIMLFEVTDPLQPKLVTGTTVDTDSTYRVSFIPSSSESCYLALNAYGQHAPVSVVANKSSHLKRKQNTADYVVITPEGLEDAVQGLTSLRESKGFETMVEELEDIYDEFNHGISNPHAIKAFLSYAYHNWKGNGPDYVVLVGEGTYDYKDNLGYEGNLVPPILMNTPHGLFASDNHFADVVGEDGVPEIAIGRLPVVTEEELQMLIDKISDYENASGGWTTRVMMLADNPDNGGNFPADSDNLASLLPGYTIDKIYLPDYPTVDEARQEVVNGFNTGALLVNYIGHAGITKLAAEGLLRSEDVSSLQNGDKLPVLTAMTCIVGRFALPGYDTLSESLLLKNNGGAVAVWAPTGASLNSLASMLAGEFFKAAFQDQEKILGKALLKVKQNYAALGGKPYMLNIYNLLGDPALEMK